MSGNIDFKALWQQQDVAAKPDISEVINRSTRLKKKARNKLLWTNAVLVVVAAYYITFLSANYHWAMITSRIGILLVIFGFVTYLVLSNGVLLTLFKSHPEADSFAYLAELVAIKRKQEFVASRVVKIYLITLSTGLALFMLEQVIKMGVIWGSVAYICLFACLAFVYFYIAPRKVKKQRAEWAAVIEKLQTINDQLIQAGHQE